MNIRAPQLTKHQHLFINSKNSILANWISYDLPKEILLQHSIEPKLFIDTYGSGVFDYFMGVISGETEIGNCPVMQGLLSYLKDREISADELFEICSHFRRSMVDFSYDAKINSKEIFDEISYIFDQNFRGILRYYTDTIFQKLIDARAKAEKATLAKDHFLSNMSHEIRTPLNAILGFVNLLIDEDLSDKHRNYLDIIHTSGETLLSIINDILDFSKLRSGEFTIEPKQFSIHEELSHTLELFVASASSKNITIISFIDPQIPQEIYADPLRIKQIVSNFLSNAIKFTPNNGKISLEAKCVNKILTISVKDSGVGIDEKDQKNIFSAFTQAYDKTIDSISGTGLGLSISKQLAELMDGKVYVESKLGRGSTFYVDVPVKVDNKSCNILDSMSELTDKKIVFYFNNEESRYKLDSLIRYLNVFKVYVDVVNDLNTDFDVALYINEDMNDTALKNHILNDTNQNYIALMSKETDEYKNYSHISSMTYPLYCSKLKNKFLEILHPNIKHKIHQNSAKSYIGNILVAEDNEANQELIKILLQKYGLNFDIVNNGLEAYDLYRQNNNYDLILMDEQMPVMDGNKSVTKILNYEKNMGLKHTPVSALTANVIKGAKERGLKSGFDSFLGKPIVLKELEKVFNLYLKQGSKKPLEQNYKTENKTLKGLEIDRLMEELQLNRDELSMLLDLYLKKMSKMLPELKVAIKDKNYKDISLLAHSIKGSSANFRIDFLQTLAYDMEKNAKSEKENYNYDEVFDEISKYLQEIEVD
ncbi:response regulator [Sulfurimonas lithotrophica]|uniref:Sensory/regulatory protein RpfC n=1 Tax=Sulfurimonas lithotrophica TaxID=2590022 RepID=A0A5P8NZB9_9BACT|nr:ATP-binding protein [Sulfurimonas lithotrophica]QFR48778.1 response regulator [Sulfurimonas lithotrophica]